MNSWSHSTQRAIGRSLIAIGLTVFAVGQAHAIPSPANSSCPPAATVAPNGSCCFDVIVRDANNVPVPGSTVVVDFGSCPVTFCPAQPPGLTVIGNTVSATSDANGTAHFCICATVTLPCTAQIRADGVLLCSVPVSDNCSPTPNRTSCWGRLKVLYR